MSENLRAGVVGAGVFGGFHARKYVELEGVDFVGVYDLHPGRAAAVAAPLGARAFAQPLANALANVRAPRVHAPRLRSV